ncbi:hypothetical protein BaOVIS_017360 [Babesia ovis]|uniref:Uncharacterized protein n=1 Tax=Babesia ovis TaxID=5869 RepID=A0A9W5TDA5_BABOV|nr:hypothetical protein BaOVIS_017360 [Babesia ovis]
MHHKKDEETIRDYTYDFAYWFAHKLMTEGLGSAPKDKDARKLWNANFKALKYHVLMSIPDEYKSGSKVKASKKDETEKAKKAEEVKKVEEVEKAEEVETVSENAQ